MLADRTLAAEFGGQRLVSADISRARDGTLLLLMTPQVDTPFGLGCVALELTSLDPPLIRRDPAGKAVVRSIQTATADTGWHTGACTHDPASATGIITVAATSTNGPRAELRATGVRP